MSEQDHSRRDILSSLAAAALAGSLPLEAAQHVHQQATEAKKSGAYKPKALSGHEFRTLEALCERILPGAGQAGAAEFLDLLASGSRQMAAIYTGGLAWIDAGMRRRFQTNFADAKPEQQTALLDLIAWRKNDSPELAAGIRFFDWARRMTVDAYFTSKVGIEAIGYKGNASMREFETPAQALEYALKRSA
ncbi:MAG: gluconate 2-dehydrogenase subunit 3 family protein [Acidobacteria bacterium]|nr:gluconate 2-dehydrogenase subunit 3 family protein [Acidobacteriota bacterium]